MGPNAQDAAARAKQLVSERKYQDAVRACRRLLLSRPDQIDVRVLLGQALLALGRHDEVRIEMQALLKKSPLVAPAHRLLGEALLRGHQSANAASALKEALRLDPEDDEARELLEELGEIDEMPPMETIERWFPEEPTRVEVSGEPATGPSGEAPASVELSADLQAEITRTSDHLSPPARPARPAKRTLLGLAMPVVPQPVAPVAPPPIAPPPRASGPLPPPSSPGVAAAPKPSVPPPPPGGGLPSAPPPRARPAKATLLGGFAPLGAPIPPPSSEAEVLESAELEAPATGELSFDDLQSASSELDDAILPPVRPDPYEHLADPAPLEGEATDARRPLGEDDLEEDGEELPGEPTRARPPVLDGLSEEQDLFVAGLPELEAEPTRARAPVDFDDETTKGREASDDDLDVARTSKAAAFDPSDHDQTSQRPAIGAFPSDSIDDEGLPPMAGEPTLARPAEAMAPRGFAPSAVPFAPSAAPFAPSAAPFAPSAAPSSSGGAPPGFAPSAGPGAGAAGLTPSGTRTERPSAKSTELTAPRDAVTVAGRTVRIGRWTLPLPTAIALAGVPVLVVVLVVLGVRMFLASRAEDAIAAATLVAQRDGLVGSLRHALELDAAEGDDDALPTARRARLYAMAALDHGFEESARADSLLASLDDEGRALQDAHVATTYLALEAGLVEAATQRSMLLDGAAIGGEAGHARAMLAFVRGELERAETEARAVLQLAPDSPRHVALLAHVLVARGKAAEALTTLDALPTAERSPSALLARAAALIASDRLAEAIVVLDGVEELGSAVSRRQHVERGRLWLAVLIAARRTDDARAQLATSLAERPVGHEAFTLDLVRAQLALGDVEGARALIGSLPPEPARRAQRGAVVAEVGLAVNDFAMVDRGLADAGESPRASFLRGRLAEARGQVADASAHYRSAAQDPAEHVRATSRLAAIALGAGDEDDAIALLEPVLPRAPADTEVVSTLAQAYLAKDRGDDASAIVAAALTVRPDALDLQLTMAEIELSRGDSAGALGVLESVIARVADSAHAQALLGEAARREGRTTLATESFERALAIDAREARALLGKVYLALDAAEPAEAEAALARAKENGAVSRGVEPVLEARVQVAQGLGDRAARTLQRFTRRTRDAALLTAYGWALAQAEDDRGAIRTFERAIAMDAGLVEAHLGLALSRTRRGDLGGAAQAIGEAEGLVQRRELGPRYEARLLAARGRILYENGSFDDAHTKATEAIAKDERCAEAHYVLALVADARGSSPVESLRRALAARSPAPEVLGQLVIFDDRAADRCELARRYIQAAPRGLDARDARSALRRCR